MRGLAVLLMVLDHVLVLTAPDHALRFTLTRASLPAFALVAGYLWRPRWTHRYGLVLLVGLVADAIGSRIGLGTPDVLLVLLVGFLGLWALDQLGVRGQGWVLAGVALVVLGSTGWNWPFTGYDPRWVLGLMAFGRGLDLAALTSRVPAPAWLTFVGRHPLTFYLGHLVALWVLGTATGVV